jgi:hypothetical protein
MDPTSVGQPRVDRRHPHRRDAGLQRLPDAEQAGARRVRMEIERPSARARKPRSMKTWSEPLTRTSVTQALLGAAPAGKRQHCGAATTRRYRVPLSRSQRDLRLGWLWPRQLVNTAGRDPLDRVEVGPPVRGEGRLVDRSIKVQALGRGARVQSFAETARSPWTDSALAHWWAGKWISPSDFASTVSCCWWMPDIACDVGGTAVITVRP